MNYHKLKYLCRIIGGGTPSKARADFWAGDIPWVSPKDMKAFRISGAQDHITPAAVADSATQIVPTSSVLVVVRSGILQHSIPIAINQVPVALNQDMKALIPSAVLMPDFLAYFIAGSQERLLAAWRKEGTTVESIEMEDLANTACPVPPRDYQSHVVNFLDRETARIDDLFAKRQRLKDLLLEALISETVSAVSRGFHFDGLIVSGSRWLGSVPKRFHVTTLRHVCWSIQTGPFGSQLHAEEYVNDGIPVVNPSNIVSGRIIADPALSVTDAVAARLSRHQLRCGDIVFGRRGEMGRCAVVTESERGWLCGTGSLRLRPNEELVDPAYLASYMSLPQVCGFLTVQSVGSTMENLNERILARVPLAYPPLSEQRAVASHVLDRQRWIRQRTEDIDNAVALLREYRAALISAAVTGQLDIRKHERKLEALA